MGMGTAGAGMGMNMGQTTGMGAANGVQGASTNQGKAWIAG